MDLVRIGKGGEEGEGDILFYSIFLVFFLVFTGYRLI